MRHRLATRGFTIIETLIFLTVSASVFGAAITQYSAQQHRNEFTQGVRGLQSQLGLLQNEVASSVSADLSRSGFKCSADNLNNKPVFFPGGPTSDNSECVYLGQVLGFGNSSYCPNSDVSNCARYVDVPVIARRVINSPGFSYATSADTFSAAKPIGLANCTTVIISLTALPCGPLLPALSIRPDLAYRAKFAYGVGIYKAFVRNSDGTAKSVTVKSETGITSSSSAIGAIGYLLSFNKAGTEATSAVNLIWMPVPYIDNTEQKTIRSIDNLGSASSADETAYVNPVDGIALCIYGADGEQAELILGENNNPADVKVQPDSKLDSGC